MLDIPLIWESPIPRALLVFQKAFGISLLDLILLKIKPPGAAIPSENKIGTHLGEFAEMVSIGSNAKHRPVRQHQAAR